MPTGVSFLLGWLLMDGYINLGGGEKDILVVVPLLFWSLVFAVSCLVLWARRKALLRSAVLSAGWATALLVVLWLGLVAVSFLLSA